MAVTWDQATFDAAYQIRIRDPAHPQFGAVLGYTREGMARALDPYTDTLDLYVQRWAKLRESFPAMAPTDRFLIAGCGFGGLIEAAKDDGFPNVWGLDSSPYVESRRGTDTRGDVTWIADTITGGGRVRAALRTATGDDEFHWIISEDMLTGYTTGEMTVLLNAAESVLTVGLPQSNIIHMVSEAPLPAPFTSLTLEEWNAIRPAHSWVSIRFSQWRVL